MTAAMITGARVSRWINTETMADQFGIEVRANRKWHHLAIDGKAALFETEAAAAAEAIEIMGRIEKVRAGAE